MPRTYTPPEGPRRLEFWIQSSRGTDQKNFVGVPADWSEAEIKDELEQWCEGFGAWGHSDNYVRYGWNDEADFGSRK